MLHCLKTRNLITLGVLLTAWVTGLSGCRFGNHVEESQQEDPVSGYYETKPMLLAMCVGDSTSIPCYDVTGLTSVPEFIDGVFTNPTWMLVADSKERVAYLTPPGGQGRYLPVRYASGKLHLEPTGTEPVQARNDPGCLRRKIVTLDGAYTRTAGPFETQTNYRPSGRLDFEIQVIENFYPNPDCPTCSCDATMAEFEACYVDINQCGGSNAASNAMLQSRAKDLFDAYVQTGALDPTRISDTKVLGYIVDYQ